MKLLQVDTTESVKEKMAHYFGDILLAVETVFLPEALGRVAAEDIFSVLNIPEFDRSTVDGYAVRAKETFGASESLPVFFDVAGKVEMGEPTNIKVSGGKAVYVPTGGMIPEGSDAMLMIEYAESMDADTLAAYKAVAPGEGIIRKGDDIKSGDLLLKTGSIINAQTIGVLAAVGIEYVKVFEKPKAAVISTGDEIVDPFGPVHFGQIRDINTYALSAMLEALGAKVTCQKVVKDDYALLQSEVTKAVESNHIVLISGGSSVGTKDVTAKVIESLALPVGDQGVFVHGVAVKPGKPTIIGRVKNTAVFGLPGHPVSAIIIFKVFVEDLVHKMQKRETRRLRFQAVSSVNIPSSPGKETYQMVEIEETETDYIASPIHAKSAAISHLAKSHGFVRIPMNKEGIKKGERIYIELL